MKYLTLLLPLAAVSSAHAAIVQYTDRAAFLAAIGPGHLSTTFSDLTPGDQGVPSIALFGGSLQAETRNAANTFAGDNFWLSDTGDLDRALGASTTFSDQVRLSGGFYAIGADWFLGDIDDNYLAGTVVLTFSDSSTYTITSSSQLDSFRGFISDSPLSSVLVSASDPGNVAGWATVDNLAVIPEPSGALLGGIATLTLAIRRRRHLA